MATGNRLLQANVGWSHKIEKGWVCHNTGCHARQLARNKRLAGKILRRKLDIELKSIEI